MFSFPQTVLSAVLSVKNTTPERLSETERRVADRICACTVCQYLWIRNVNKIPMRCPKCHTAAWDRPLLSALMSRQTTTTSLSDTQDKNSERGDQ